MSGSAFKLRQQSEDCDIQLVNSSIGQFLFLLAPSNSSAWHGRTESWFAFFYLLMVIYCAIFLGIALACIFLLIKRHLVQRFRIRTFIAIDLALIILGVSRVLFILLDPWGQLGFCNHLACIIISRLLGALAFPSLTASYTLVFITIWLSARIELGMPWIQRLKILIPLCFVHYGVAVSIEVIATLPFDEPLVIFLILVICEVVFSLWGFLVCLLFLIAGFRLLKIMKKTAKRSSRICKDTPTVSRYDLIETSDKKGSTSKSKSTAKQTNIIRGQLKKSIRKVTLITYITVSLGITYSILSIFNTVMVLLIIFKGCFGRINVSKQHPELWLALRYIFFTLESCMAMLLTYAISDYTPLINLLKKCCKCNKKGIPFSCTVEDMCTVKVNYANTETVEVDSPSQKLTGPINTSLHDDSSPDIPRKSLQVSSCPLPQIVSHISVQ